MHTISRDRFGEWPIKFWFYTKHKGKTMEQVIDMDLDWFLWAVTTFQNVTPTQADYFEKKTGKKLNPDSYRMSNHTNTLKEIQKRCIWKYAEHKTCMELYANGEGKSYRYFK